MHRAPWIYNVFEAFNEGMMERFQGAWTYFVTIPASVALLLTFLLLVTYRQSRKLRAQRTRSGAARWQKWRRILEFLNMLAGILVLCHVAITLFFGKDKSPPLWVIIGGVVVGAMPLVIKYAQTHGDAWRADDVWTQKVRSLVARWPLPMVSEVDPYSYLGVTQSELANRYVKKGERPPYVPRDIDSELDTVLMAHELVLVVGHSKSGKSRTAYESILRRHPQQPLIIPSDGKALAELFRLELPMEWESNPAIVWLDELDRFLGPTGLSPSLLNSLCQDKGRLKLIATLTTKRHDDYLRSTSDVDKDSRIVLRRFREVHLDSQLSAAETQQAQAVFRDEPREKLTAGLGEHLIAAHVLMLKYETGKTVRPQGHALVRAAIDWRRAGMLRPIPETVLRTLAGQYLDALMLPHVDLTPESFKEGLDWAREPVGHLIALLGKAPGVQEQERSFEPFDYLVDHVDRQEMAIPDKAWEAILDVASPADALQIGRVAYRRQHRAIARKALEQAILAGEPDVTPPAAFVLGVIFQQDHEFADADRLYRVAIDSKHPGVNAMAKINLGVLLLDRGELDEAERLIREGLDSKQEDVASKASVNLGIVHLLRRELAEAERLFREGIHAREAGVVATAKINLGRIFMDRGQLTEAESLFREVEVSQANEAAMATLGRGTIHLKRGEWDEAERIFRALIGSKKSEVASMAANNLGSMLMNRGELSEAERLFREVINSKQVVDAATAMGHLGVVHLRRGELAEAERLFREVIGSKQLDVAAMARNNLGEIHWMRGELDEAERLFHEAIESRQLDAANYAHTNLGRLFIERGKLAEAERLFREALHSNQLDVAARGKVDLSVIHLMRGERAEAERLLQEVIHSKQPEAAAMAMALLGEIHLENGALAESEQLLREVIRSKQVRVVDLATVHLGVIHRRRGEFSEAERLFRSALESHDPKIEARASMALGLMFQDALGDVAGAKAFYRRALGSEEQEIVRYANLALDSLVRRAPGSSA